MNYLISLFLLVSMIACHANESVQPVHGQGLAGTWLLVESGYSPGGGYIVNKVPTTPQQTLTFTADGKIQAQGDGLKFYQSFNQFQLDTVNTLVRTHYSPSTDNHYDFLFLRNDTLKLSQPACIEGCHIGFVRIK